MAAMTRRTERTARRGGFTPLVVLGWLLALVAVFFCCAPSATAGPRTEAPAASAVRALAPVPSAAVSAVRALAPVPSAAVSVVRAEAPDERGPGSSCHGATSHSTPVVLPGSTAPVALPCASVVIPADPLTGAAAIRGPSHDGVGSVDRLRLQVQRV
ncbi:hypothetical protein OG596_04155 [Streptomyces sp. NBC_01102]|uniref:hypothetical protein n=1 Tax=unclassified Streptomyces TaxID=2593676 RepID=UPI003863EEED|nr:hypothetical protein OG596_04155 [Streptomyces sp. NBC_01102]